ncbi:MAG: RHS repeat-associated core domain-containing protein, partial [Chloroflexi bacterium]|nr:RHS repeat-associated core domain-containing protein [Chloroflexota bacterium]
SAGYAYDRRGRQTAAPGHSYTWDGASRLVGVAGVSLSYDGLGDVASRTEAGQTTRYAYNAALGLRPIVAEQDGATGQFTRYYVWTPGGQLLYLIDAASGNRGSFYHFDRAGSTLALTDASGVVADAYAYTPYGRLLGHEGSSPQPFTFVGQYGVRQEGASGTLYHMRARYYDASSGRFLSREPIWPAIANPRQVNPYQYALANPVRFVDPGGTDAVPGGGLWGDPMSPTVLKFGVSSLVDECLSEALLLGNPFQLFDCRELLSEATEEEERVEELMNSQSSKRLESGRVPQDGGWGGTPSSQLIGQRQTATKLSQQPLAQTDKVLTQTSGTGKPQQSAAPRRLLSNEDWMQIESYERRAKEKQAKLEQFRAKGLSGLFDPEEVAALRQNLPEAEFMQLAQDYAAGLEADVDRYNQRIDEILNQR